jgi:prepilin-type N-terminal cleavage/methylation domain-containing protein
MFERVSRSKAGFSLAEVLVALAVAAMLVATLTKFVIGTRNHAMRVREAVEMSALSESLLANIQPERLSPGTSGGRRGPFTWHIYVTAISYTAFGISMNENKVTQTSSTEASNIVPGGLNSLAGTHQQNYNGVPFHIGLVISAPSGSKYIVDTMRVRFDKAD